MSKDYQPIFDHHHGLSLFEVCRQHCNFEQQEALLEDILDGNVAPLKLWIFHGRESYEILLNSPAALAFEALLQEPADWLNDHYLLFEKKVTESLEAGSSGEPLFQKIKALVEETRSGITFGGIAKLLPNTETYYPEIIDLELHLLMLKIQENISPPEQWDEFFEEKLDRRPWLVTALIYAFRKKNPQKAISMLMKWERLKYKPSENLQRYTSVYLRHALYNLLNQAPKETYIQFRGFLEGIEQNSLRDLLEHTLAHEQLTEIAYAYHMYDRIGLTEDKLRQLDRKIDESDQRSAPRSDDNPDRNTAKP